MPAAANAATQIGTAVLVLARDPAGPHAMTLHLQPPDLGHVAIAIAPPHAGETRIALTVQQPETLLLLLRDQPALHKALDSAGIAQDGRVVTFHLAPTDAPAPVAAPANGAFNDAGQPGTQDRGNRAPQHASAARSDHPSAKNDAAADHTLPPRRAPRPGVDITA